MPLSPEESQFTLSLQQRILANVAKGKPGADGITAEELKQGLDLLRRDRAKALSAGVEKAGGKKKAAKAPEGPSDLDAKLKARGLDLSKLD